LWGQKYVRWGGKKITEMATKAVDPKTKKALRNSKTAVIGKPEWPKVTQALCVPGLKQKTGVHGNEGGKV